MSESIAILEAVVDDKAQEFMNEIGALVKLLGGPGLAVATDAGPRTLAEVVNELQVKFQDHYSTIKLTARMVDSERIRSASQVVALSKETDSLVAELAMQEPVTFEGRLQVEEKKLRDNINKLDAFLSSDKTGSVATNVLAFMGDQLTAMNMYHDALLARMVILKVDTLPD